MDYSQQFGFYPNSQRKELESFSYKRISNEEEIQNFIFYIRGFTPEYNPKTQQTEFKLTSPPLMNEEGISFISTCLRMITSKGVVTGYLDDDTWRLVVLRELNDVAKGLIIEHEKFNLNKDKLTLLYGSLRGLIISTLSRQREGFEATNTAPNIVETIQPQKPLQQMQPI